MVDWVFPNVPKKSQKQERQSFFLFFCFFFTLLSILEDDQEQKIAEDSQEKDYLPDFQLDEDVGDGEDIEEDILLEGEEEGDNDVNDEGDDEEGDDEEGDDEDFVEEEEKMEDGDVKDVEEGMEVIKLQEDNGEDIVQIPADDDKDKEDEVKPTFFS